MAEKNNKENQVDKSKFKTYKDVDEFLKPKKVKYTSDRFNDLLQQDVILNDEDMRIKLNKNISSELSKWIKEKIAQKENISISIKGSTRSGKSLVGLKLCYMICKETNQKFDTSKIVCANQKEFRQKLQDASFGEVFLIDENVFSSAGMGAGTEREQLQDIQNIIAKKNIHTIYITPKVFLEVGSKIGLDYLSKDIENWKSKFLIYNIERANPYLMGFVSIDVGELFYNNGCTLYKLIGGCTNPKRIPYSQIPQIFIDYNYKNGILSSKEGEENIEQCPFYNVCSHPLCLYEHKKDSWIEREMKGNSLDERTEERYNIAKKIFLWLAVYDSIDEEKNSIKFDVGSASQLQNKINMKIKTITNTKLTNSETAEIFKLVKNLSDLDMVEQLEETLGEEEPLLEQLRKIESGEYTLNKKLDIEEKLNKDNQEEEKNQENQNGGEIEK